MSKTPDQIQSWLAANLHRFDQPVQYLGTEPNARRKPWADARVRWLLAASWPYFHSAGNQSIPAVYQSINDHPGYMCDLSYLPEKPRDLRILERAGIPIFGIESKHEMLDFDVVGTSISYMVLFINFCKYLKMSGMPLRWKDREAQGLENFPMVIVGGQAFCAPGAMEPVVDCVWLGEVEDEEGNGGISDLSARIEWFKSSGLWSTDRLECYKQLALEFNHLYFPRFVGVEYGYRERGLEHPSKQVIGYRSLLPGMRMPFRARKVQDLDKRAPLRSAPLLFSDPSMGAGDIEVARGCPAWCSFCRLTFVQKPYRQNSVDYSVAHAAEWRLNMGSAELSPFGPDFPMHTQKKLLLARLLAEVGDEIDTTAMRIDDFSADPEYIMLQALGGADAVTLGLEGNSQRMRDLVGKGTSDADVEAAVIKGIRAGFRKFKLFMISNMPGEDEGDVFRIVRLARRLAAIRDELGQPNVRFQMSWTPLLIEAQTPFQWFAPTPPDHRLIDVADAFRDLKVDFKIGTKAEPHKVAFFQLCQRASREVGEAIVDVLEALDAACWGGVPRGPDGMEPRLAAALLAHGFNNGFADCFDERFRTDMFGWEWIDTGVSMQLLWNTYVQMVEFLEATDSTTYDDGFDGRYHGQEWIGRCDTTCKGAECGACSPKDLHLRKEYIRAADSELSVDLSQIVPVDLTSEAFKVRARLNRPAQYRWVSNKHWRYNVRRAAYRAIDSLREILPPGTNIAKRSIVFASDTIKVKDLASGFDYVEFALTRHVPDHLLQALMVQMRAELIEWVSLSDWLDLPADVDVVGDAGAAYYELALSDDPDTVKAKLAHWASSEYVKLTLRTDTAYFGVGTEEYNARDLVPDLWVTSRAGQQVLRMLVTGGAGPYQVYAALMGKPGWLDAAAEPAYRGDFFTSVRRYPDLLSLACEGCGFAIPVDLMAQRYSDSHCPRCMSEDVDGNVVAALPRVAVETV